MRTAGVSGDFKGVYPYIDLHTAPVTERGNSILIINVGAHYVVLFISPQQGFAIYADPVGAGIKRRAVHQYLKKFPNLAVFSNKKQIQSLASSHCGPYALLLALHFDNPAYKLKFDPDTPMKNDEKCIQYLKKYTA